MYVNVLYMCVCIHICVYVCTDIATWGVKTLRLSQIVLHALHIISMILNVHDA